MLEMYQPAPFAASLRWKKGKVDGSATISGWLSGRGRLVSFACYMGELEVKTTALLSLLADPEVLPIE